jgi:hydroxymethylbilane synthase
MPLSNKAPMQRTFILGSRGSELALTQSRWVMAQLQAAIPDLKIELQIIKTQGDVDQTTRLDAFPAWGVFVKELQVALLEKRIDFAVHSLKDVPDGQPEGLILAAFPPREDARDVFISQGLRFRDLPAGALVGTGSPRRVMQLKALRPDLNYVPLRGNVDTRVRKVKDGELAATLLAAAGLKRLGRSQDITHTFGFHELIPAIGQAALALECRAADAEVRQLLAHINDETTEDLVRLERQFMSAVGGGCKVPMAAHAYPYGDGVRFLCAMGKPDGTELVRLERSFSFEDAEDEVDDLAEILLEECLAKGIPTPDKPDASLR